MEGANEAEGSNVRFVERGAFQSINCFEDWDSLG